METPKSNTSTYVPDKGSVTRHKLSGSAKKMAADLSHNLGFNAEKEAYAEKV